MNKTKSTNSGFTMAEILISLTIIGVIAAITLPSLRANINETTWNTQRKALHSRMSQAIAMMPSLNGYGIGATDEETASKAAEVFITDGLSKVLKITNVCDSENLKKCGFPDKFTRMGTNSKMDTPKKLTNLNGYFNAPNDTNVNYSQIDTNSAAFETANGESILTFYNPNCSYTYGVNGKNGKQTLMQPTMCANFIYDLNGRKGPNKVGKDIGFMTAFYPTDSQLAAPVPYGQVYVKSNDYPQFTIGNANLACKKKYGDNSRMANIEELKSVFVNNKLGYGIYVNRNAFLEGATYVSSSMSSASGLYTIVAYSGAISYQNIMSSYSVMAAFCIKK